MSVLGYTTLLERGPSIVVPFDASRVQPASIDLTLSDTFCTYTDFDEGIDLKSEREYIHYKARALTVKAFGFSLASTEEVVEIPNDLVARIEGKSSLGRHGVFVHVTAGYIDPGFRGQVTLEIFNANPLPLTLYAGMPVAQLSLHRLDAPCERPYGATGLGSKYQDQVGPMPSRFHENFRSAS